MKKIIYPVLLLIFSIGFFHPIVATAQEEEAVTDVEVKEKKERKLSLDDSPDARINWDKVLKDWSVGLHAGVTMPYTDVRSYDWVRKVKPVNEIQYGVGANITKMMGNVFGLQGRYTYGKLQGFSNYNSDFNEDAQFWEIVGIEYPFYFSTQYHQASVNLYMNFSNMFIGLNRRIRAKIKDEPLKERRVSAYGRAGIGAMWFDSKLHYIDLPANLTQQQINQANNVINKFGYGYSGKANEMVFPFALGIKVKVNHLIDVHVEGEFTLVHDDKLDAFIIEDVSKDQYILDILNGDNIPPERVRNSLGGRYDKHLLLNAGINFKFGTLKSQNEHLEWVNPLEAYMDDNDAKVQYLLDNMYEVKDADNDGVIDELDLEPNSAPEARVNTHGVTMDSDGDGIPDHEDPEPYSTDAFPIVDGKNVYPETMTPDEIKEYVTTYVAESAPKSIGWSLSIIFFDLDKANVKSDMIPELYKVAATMKKYPDLTVNVKGHTDIRYTDEYNQKLAEKRTEAAINYLVEKYGISKDRFIPQSFGETENLVKDAKRESEHKLNRRVEFTPANY
ncbi:MAG: OmpA family protein [Bacteroidetes bacterium]|nr:OmpA family protein [Bacteroidota bacterium]